MIIVVASVISAFGARRWQGQGNQAKRVIFQ
jgi:hypothetical protein